MFNLRLLFRLYRNGGTATLLRVGLMTVGVLLVLLAALASTSVASGVASLTDRANSRFPVDAGNGEGTFQATITSDFLGTAPVRIVRVAAKPGAAPPAPPGCADFPRTGESCVSPALQHFLTEHPALAGKAGDRIAQTIGEAGLTDESEFVAYVGVAFDPSGGANVGGWGRTNGSAPPLISAAFLGVALLLLVGLPAGIFLALCGRLSSNARARRTRVLRMLGAPRRTVLLVTASDGIAAGVAAAGLALASWTSLGPWFAGSGLAGFQWFPTATPLTPVTVFDVLIGTPVMTGWLATVGGRRGRSNAVTKSPRPASKLWLAVVGLGVVASGWYFVDAHHSSTHPKGWLFLSSAALLAVGTLVAVRPLTELVSAMRAPRARTAVTRLAWRRLEVDCAPVVRVAAGAAIFVLVATIGLAVSRDVQLTATNPGPSVALTVNTTADTTAAQRVAIGDLPSLSAYATVAYATAAPGDVNAAPQFATALFATCRSLGTLVGRNVAGCEDGHGYRATDVGDHVPPAVDGGVTLFDQADAATTLTAPAKVLDLGSWGLGLVDIVVTSASDPVPVGASYHYQVGNSDAQVIAFQEHLATVSPTLVGEPGIDINSIKQFNAINSVLRIAVLFGFVLGLAALLVAAADRAFERRREVAHLTAIGVSIRTLRFSQILQLAIVATISLGATAVAGQIVAEAYLTLGGDQKGWYWPSFYTGATLAAVGILVCAITGVVVFGRRITYELLAAT